MTVVATDFADGVLVTVEERLARGDDDAVRVTSARRGRIASALSIGADVTRMHRLRSNQGLACPGVQLSGQGFIVSESEIAQLSSSTRDGLVRPYITGRDLTQRRREQFVIDTGMRTEDELRADFPDAYQRLWAHVRPERIAKRGATKDSIEYATNWWRFSKPRPHFRRTLEGLNRFAATSRTVRHRVFQFEVAAVLPETKVLIIAFDDAAMFGVLSSRVHVTFANTAGGWLGVGNDSTYNHSDCFDPFPFPIPTDLQRARIRLLGENLDAHRKRQQTLHADLTITGMYNVLEKLRSGEPLTDKEPVIHEHGLVSILKQLHDELDATVFDAYGWPRDLTDEQILERLVALNAERAQEERNGLVRWLRPEFQNPAGTKAATQATIAATEEVEEVHAVPAVKVANWPKKLPERIAAVRDLVLGGKGTWSMEQVVAAFGGARRADVEGVIESLAALGIVVAYGDAKARRYRAAGRVAA